MRVTSDTTFAPIIQTRAAKKASQGSSAVPVAQGTAAAHPEPIDVAAATSQALVPRDKHHVPPDQDATPPPASMQ